MNDSNRSSAIKFGCSLLCGDNSIRPDKLAREMEVRGFESLWLADHSYIPVESEGRRNMESILFSRCLDQFVAMTAAVMATQRLKIAAGMCILPQRDPLAVAKAVSSLDYLSGGRVIFGVGAGWNEVEMRNHGTPFDKRYAILNERVRAVCEVWAGEQAEFHGQYANFDKIWTYPRPLQRPRPPIIAGLEGPKGMRMMIEWADGWCPTPAILPSFRDKISTVKEYLLEAGRDPDRFPISIFLNSAWVTTDISRQDIELLENLGVCRVILNIPPEGEALAMRTLDEYAKLLE